MPNTNLYPKIVPIPVRNDIVNEFIRQGFNWNHQYKAFTKNNGNIRIRSGYNNNQGIVWIVTRQEVKATTGHNQNQIKSETLHSWGQLRNCL